MSQRYLVPAKGQTEAVQALAIDSPGCGAWARRICTCCTAIGQRSTFHGRVVAAARAGATAGPIVVEIAAEGLPVQRLRLDAVTP